MFSLSGADLRFLHTASATDREVTYSFTPNETKGTFDAVRVQGGAVCKHEHGVKNCTVDACKTAFCIHTHLVGNRISGQDLAVAIKLPTRQMSGILTPLGVYFYRPTAELKRRFLQMTTSDQRRARDRWRSMGFVMEKATQRGDVQEYVAYLREEGFEVSYRAWVDIGGTEDRVWFSLP